nr:cytochrome b [Prosthogonimus pellucidus]
MYSLFCRNVIDLPTNISLNYFWCGGFMLSFFLLLQVVSGVVLSLLYVSDCLVSFGCVLDISGDSFFGWVVRYLHVWGVSFIFCLLLIHIGRSLYYSSYVKFAVWNVGFVLYLLMMVEAFLGYVLPWHQMSYWAATVLTSILQVLPLIGPVLYKFVVGGFSVTGVTLVRVFSLHVCLAFLLIGLSVLHLYYLHASGSNNPLVLGAGYGDFVFFSSYYVLKDGFVLFVLLSFLFFFMWGCPDFFLDVESFIEADPLVTPVSIKPEWYFLAFYAMLRSVSSKLGGLVLVIIFLVLLWLPSLNSSCVYYLDRQFVFWLFVWFFFVLSVLGSLHPEVPFVSVSFYVSLLAVLLLSVFKGGWVVGFFIPNRNLFSLVLCF